MKTLGQKTQETSLLLPFQSRHYLQAHFLQVPHCVWWLPRTTYFGDIQSHCEHFRVLESKGPQQRMEGGMAERWPL
jgi:hypothetical protein